jgi:NADPH-dependent 2,4-dienoyl-CoA reductase/sulfur reductase-like enzyme
MGAAVWTVNPLGADDHVLIAGGGLAGWRFVEECRRLGFTGRLTMVSDESLPPYDRPPLSKQVLSGKWGFDQILLATPDRRAATEVDLILGDAATAFDTHNLTVTLASGRELSANRVVIATGTTARHLPFGDGLIHYLRTFRDVVGLHSALALLPDAPRVGVIGGGFIGAEVATALRGAGADVTVLEAASAPLVTVLGETIAGWLGGLPEAAGVRLLTNQQILDVVRNDSGVQVVREGEPPLTFDLVVAGVGAVPSTSWLASSGLDCTNGVVVDASLLVTPFIGAIGDVARFTWDSVTGQSSVRIEHWQMASDHAARLAATWCSPEAPLPPLVPYFWSDQYGAKIQVVGRPSAGDDVVMVRGEPGQSWVALSVRDQVVAAIITLGQPRALMRSRDLVTTPHRLEVALALAPWND